jgi:hypothetical protein
MRYKSIVTLTLLIATVFLMSAFMPQQEAPKFTNLKVLPKDISKDDLGKVMDGFKTALGVKCNFCHAQGKADPKRLDFASDEKPEKDMARQMMKMTSKINKRYFHIKGAEAPNAVLAVNCISCHNGKAHPETAQ